MTAMRPLLPRAPYHTLRETFRWDIPDRLNMATQVCDGWAARDPDRVTIRDLSGEALQDITYAALRDMADALAWALTERGVVRGDRVEVLRSQGAWCAAAHIAIWKIGAISIPLFQLFKRDSLRSRLEDSGAKLVATVAVVGKPDRLRTEIVKAFVMLKDGVFPSESLAQDLQDHVKGRLASYSYLREIAFVDALPMTVTGKVIRKELKALAAAEADR